ncbi:hypothetical protein QBC44DRAFT_234614 [Cladorrhinum sp. PSN332]|nr:hypothetical protein QBC44DRAFT_234614 [Cladorrhinum sp. PSN332]
MPGPPRKTSPIEPIMLWGFCFSTQAKQNFNTPWGAAWLTNQYTDERHEMWEHIGRDDLAKKREIKYGNNIAVLFGALLECKAFWGQEGFWHATARGFNTNSTILRCTVEILTDARRIQRGKPAKEISDTARAADRWIGFLDSDEARLKHRGEPSDNSLNRITDAYFKKQEKAWVNAAWVPINPKSDHSHHNRAPSPTRIKSEPGPSDIHALQARSASMRKRSPSPAPFDSRSSKIRRMSFISGSGEALPPTGPRGHHRDHDYPVHKPDPDYHRRESRDWERNWDRGHEDHAIAHRDDHLHKELQARIVNLEEELVQARTKLTAPDTASTTLKAESTTAAAATITTTTTTNSSSNQLGTQMNSVTEAVSTMMESMHDIVDGLTRLQEEVSVISTKLVTIQQPDNASASENNSIDKFSKLVLDPLSTISSTLQTLQSEIASLKKQSSTAPSSDVTELKSLLKQQSDQIAALVRLQQQQQQKASPTPKPVPQTIQQAIHNAERDLWHHYSAVSDFYHKLDINKTSRATTERTAEFLAVLQHSVESAKAMSGRGTPGS